MSAKIDWNKLGFDYIKTNANIRCRFDGRKWSPLTVTDDEYIHMHMATMGLHYGIMAFEGLKAFRDSVNGGTNYAGKVAAALEAAKKFDLIYVHVEAIDECSHLGDLKLKLQAIEDFDAKIVAPVLSALEGRGFNFAVLPDHPVPIKLRKHTTTPVPLAVCGPGFAPDPVTRFSETDAPTGKLGLLRKEDLVRKLLGL